MPSITWFKNGVEMKNNKDQNQITVSTNKQKEQVQLQATAQLHRCLSFIMNDSYQTSKLRLSKSDGSKINP